MKQSLLIGALTSSFGIFVSKLLGLLYYSPLSAIAGESNMAFYSIVYTYYDLLLQISQAGIPFAIASRTWSCGMPELPWRTRQTGVAAWIAFRRGMSRWGGCL